MIKNKEIKNYYKAVKKSLNCSNKQKLDILHALESDIKDYIEENPNTTINEIQKYFGSPSEFASESISTFSDNEIKQKINRSKTIKVIAAVSAIVFIIISAITAYSIAKENSRTAVYYYSEEVGINTEVNNETRM